MANCQNCTNEAGPDATVPYLICSQACVDSMVRVDERERRNER